LYGYLGASTVYIITITIISNNYDAETKHVGLIYVLYDIVVMMCAGTCTCLIIVLFVSLIRSLQQLVQYSLIRAGVCY